MSHNNAAEVNFECEKAMASLLDLNDFALLYVFSYLNLKDSINFAETSKRLKSVSGLHFTKYKRLDLFKYELFEQPKKLLPEAILPHIGKHVKTLKITSMRLTMAKAVMDNCVNVTTLKMYRCNVTSKLEKWMQQLKLESLTMTNCSHFNEMSVGLAALKELHFICDNAGLSSMQLTNILEKTTELETLQVELYYSDFSFDIFTKLPKLQCLDIDISSENLENLAEFLQMDVLTRFKIDIINDSPIDYAEDLRCLNSFIGILAERSKLHELQLHAYFVDQRTFHILKSFHVTSLGFCADVYRDHVWDDRWMIHQLVVAQPNLQHLDFLYTTILIEEADLVVKNLLKLETLRFETRAEDLDQLDELQINEMLKTTTSRPMLTLCIHSHFREAVVKIELWFEQRKHRIDKFGGNRADDSYFLTDRFTGAV